MEIPRGHVDISLGQALGDQDAFELRKLSFVVVIGPSGQLIGLEDLAAYPLAGRFRSLTRTPIPLAQPDGQVLTFLWGKRKDALGLGRWVERSARYSPDPKAFDAFRAQQKALLEGVADIGLQAFVKFLDQWSPREAAEIPAFRHSLGTTVAFRFQYDDECLHQTSAARVIWKRRLGFPDF